MMTFICELCLMNHVQVFYRLITEHFLSRGMKRCEIRGPVKSPTFKHLALESYALWASTSKLPGEWQTTSDRGARVARQNNSSAQHIRQTKSTSSFQDVPSCLNFYSVFKERFPSFAISLPRRILISERRKLVT